MRRSASKTGQHRSAPMLLAVLASSPFICSDANGQITSWRSAVSGSWETAANWSLGVPGPPSSTVANITIGGSYTVTLNSTTPVLQQLIMSGLGASTFSTLRVASGGTLRLSTGTINIAQLDIAGGTLQFGNVTGPLHFIGGVPPGFPGGPRLRFGGANVLPDPVFNTGTINSNGMIVIYGAAPSTLNVNVVNQLGIETQAGASATLLRTLSGNGALNLTGAGSTLTLAGGGMSSSTISLGSTSFLRVGSATFNPSASTFTIAAGSTLAGNGTISFESGASVVNIPWNHTGATQARGGSVTFNAAVSSPVLATSTAVSVGVAKFNAPVSAPITVGSSSGSTAFQGIATLNSSFSGTCHVLFGGVAVGAQVAPGGVLQQGNWIIEDGAFIGGLAGNATTLDFRGTRSFSTLAGFQNTGTILRSGSGSTTVSNSFGNTGVLTITSGRVSLNGGVLQLNDGVLSAGTWNVIGSSSELAFGGLAVTQLAAGAAVTLDGAGARFEALDSLERVAGRLELRGGRTFATTTGSTSFVTDGTLAIGATSQMTLNRALEMGDGGDISLSSDAIAPGRLILNHDLRYGGSTITARLRSTGGGALPGRIDLGGAQRVIEVADGAAAADLRISARMVNGGITKTGPGVLILDAGAEYDGLTQILAGSVDAAVNGAIPATSVVQIGDGTLVVSTSLLDIGALESVGTNALGRVQLQDGTLRLNTSDVRTYDGPIIGTGGLSKAGVGIQILAGSLSFTGPLSVSGGDLVLGSSSNTFTGPITVSGSGRLSVPADANLGNAGNSITLSGSGTLGGVLQMTESFSTTRDLGINGVGVVEVLSGHEVEHTGSISSIGPSTFRKSGEGRLQLAGGSMAGTISVGLLGGELAIVGGRSAFPNVGAYQADLRGTLVFDQTQSQESTVPPEFGGNPDLHLSGGTFTLLGAPGTLTAETLGTLSLGDGASTIRLVEGAGGRTLLAFDQFGTRAPGATLNVLARGLDNNATLSTNRLTFAAGLALNADIGGWFTVQDPDTGSVSFASYTATGVQPLAEVDYVNSFQRNEHVKLNASATVPDDSGTGGTNPYTIKTLTLDAAAGSLTVTIPSAPSPVIDTLSLTQGGLIKNGAFESLITGGTLTSASGELNINVGAGALQIDSRLAGAFTLTKRGAGTLLLAGSAASAYTGATVISGFLDLNKTGGNAVPGDLTVSGGSVRSLLPDQIADSGCIILNAGTFNLNGQSETVRCLQNNNGTVLFGGGTLTVTEQASLAGGTTAVASTLNVNSGTANLLITGGANTVFAETASSAAGVVKVGSGGLTFSGPNSPSIQLQSAAGGFSPGRLELGGDVTVTATGAGTARITISGAGATPGVVDLGTAARTFTIASGAARDDLEITAAITGSAGGIVKTGDGALRLTGAGSFGGGVTVNAGILEAARNNALGSGSVQINAGILSLRSNNPLGGFGNDLRSESMNASIDIDVLDGAGTPGTFRLGTGTLAGALNVAGRGTLSIGSGTQTHTLAGDLTLSSFTNTVIDGNIAGGSSELVCFTAPPPGFGPGEGLPRRDAVGAAGTLTVTGGTTANVYAGMTANDGTVVLNRPNSVVAVPNRLTINAGVIRLGGGTGGFGAEQIADNALVTLNGSSAVLDLNNSTETIGALALNGGTVLIGSGTLILTGAVPGFGPEGGGPAIVASGTFASTISGRIRFADPTPFIGVNDGPAENDLILGGQLRAPDGFSKGGAGKLALSGDNSTTLGGTISIIGGVLSAAAPNALGTSTLVIANAVLQSSVTVANPVLIAGLATLDVPAGQTATVESVIATQGMATIPLTKTGDGTLALSAANTFRGQINVNAGTLRFGSSNNLGDGSNSIRLQGGVLQYAGSASLLLNRSVVISSGGIDVSSPTAGLSVTASGTSPFWTLQKSGPGPLTLSVSPPLSDAVTLETRSGPLIVSGTNLLTGGTLLAGRSYGVYGSGALQINSGNITYNAADVTLSGPGSSFSQLNALVENTGNLTLLAGRSFSVGTFNNTGRLDANGVATAFISTGTLTNPGRVRIADRARVRVNGVLANTGTIDVAGGDLVVDYAGASPFNSLRSQVISGYAGGSWNGAGIQSTLIPATAFADAIGYAEATDLSPAVLAALNIGDSTAVVLRYTLGGDADLDLTVTIGDFARLAANFNLSAGWSTGDFDYSGFANIGDFALLAGNFNRGINSAPLGRYPATTVEPAGRTISPGAASVPEPRAALAALGLIAARRRSAKCRQSR